MSVIKLDRRDEANVPELMSMAFDIAFKKQPCIVLLNEPFVSMRINGAKLKIIDQLERVTDTNRGVFVIVRTEEIPPRMNASIDSRFWEYIDTEMFVPLPKYAQRMDIVRHASVMICGQLKIQESIKDDMIQFLASVTRFEVCGNIALLVARIYAEHAISMAAQMQMSVSDLKPGDVRLIPNIRNAETTLESYSSGIRITETKTETTIENFLLEKVREHFNYSVYLFGVRHGDYAVKIPQSTRLILPSMTVID
jgi:hypothetical protein